jgi:hypothetical protein
MFKYLKMMNKLQHLIELHSIILFYKISYLFPLLVMSRKSERESKELLKRVNPID